MMDYNIAESKHLFCPSATSEIMFESDLNDRLLRFSNVHSSL